MWELPDLEMPAQFWAGRRKNSPEMKLAAAVLLEAARCLHKPRGSLDARRWFLSKDDGIFSFIGICEWLGASPSVVREAVFGDEKLPLRSRGGGKDKRIRMERRVRFSNLGRAR